MSEPKFTRLSAMFSRRGTILLAVTLGACSAPTAPASSGAPAAPIVAAVVTVSGLVIDASGACIDGATVEVVGGQAIGQKMVQVTPCDVWWPFGGFSFKDVTPGIVMTLRASASGFVAKDVTVVAPANSLEIKLSLTVVQ